MNFSNQPAPDALAEYMDWAQLHQISDGNTEFELELLKLYLEDSWLHLAALKAAIANQNVREIEHEAHHLKGSSSNVGVKQVQALATLLEQQARQQQIPTAPDLPKQLESALQRIQDLVQNWTY